MVFVNSMSDLFHKEIDREFINQAFDTMEAAHWHVYQVLAKRSSLMRRYVRDRYRDGAVPEARPASQYLRRMPIRSSASRRRRRS